MMRELRVEDALLYLDQVKVEFGDRPHIYNEFLDIMKTFKTQQIDTPGVIRRVSTLFQGNKKLVLGFNTFLPEGYKIELPIDGDGIPVAVYRVPGQPGVTHILAGPPPPENPAGSRATVAPQQMEFKFAAHPPPSQQHTQSGAGMVADQPGFQQHHQQHIQQQRPSMQQQTQQQPHAQQQQQQQQPRRPIPPGPPRQQPGAPRLVGRIPQQVGVEFSSDARTDTRAPLPPQQQEQQISSSEAASQPPVEFDHAINYVTTIKRRFATEPDTYKKFLEILHTYQKEQRGIKEVLDEVSVLFAEHPDLLKEFTYFLPDAVQAQAKAQLDQVAKEAEAKIRSKAAKQAIMQTAQGMQPQAVAAAVVPRPRQPTPVQSQQGSCSAIPAPIPFGATQGRSDEREREICRSSIYGSVSFAAVRPPRRKELSPAAAATKNGRPQTVPELPIQPTTAEAAFFERAKLHLKRKELAPDKPPGSRRHTPYTEFLKCLHLFGANILNKEELVALLRGLLMQGHAPKSGVNAGGGACNPAVANDAQELLREFEEVLVGRGHFANQENAIKNSSKYGGLQVRDFDFSHSEKITPSYRSLPNDYPQNILDSHSGQTESDASVLNSEVVCVAPKPQRAAMMSSPEDYDGPCERNNPYEETMFRIEDERYEVDMAIERNANAMRQVEPMAEEVTQLRECEEKDGQPIGRMHYKLRSRQLNCAQVNAIARLYGDSGDEVLQHLMRNPVAVLPIVYQRLSQKDAEWRKVKLDMSKKWNAVYESNYEGCMDATCFEYKKDLEKSFDERHLRRECKSAGTFLKDQSHLASEVSTRDFRPTFLSGTIDNGTMIFQPHLRVEIDNGMSHKDAYHLLATQVSIVSSDTKPSPEKEYIARIWAEFMVPMFGYPVHWVLNELRDSIRENKSSSVVRYAIGQLVMTAYGEGLIEEVIEGNVKAGLRYKIKLPFVTIRGGAFLRPESILYVLHKSGQDRFVRDNGKMKVLKSNPSLRSSGVELDSRFITFFANESVYRFLRLYCLLVQILSNSRESIQGERKEPDVMDVEKKDDDKKKDTKTYDYPSYLLTAKKCLTSDMSEIDFERYCRRTTRNKVAQLTIIPKLVEKCVDALLRVSRDNVLLTLFDFAIEKDPVKLRSHCLNVVENAFYRIQYSSEDRACYFAHVEPDQDLMTMQGVEDTRISDDQVTDDGVEDMMEDDVVEDEAVHVESFAAEREAKKQKVH